MLPAFWAKKTMRAITTFLSTPFLCGVLSENGRLGLAYELLNQKTIPSWLYSVLSIYGEISSAWQTGPREFTLDVTISPNTSARVYLPMKEPQQITEGSALLDHREGITSVQPENGSTVVAVGSGTYHFACPVISQ